MTSADMVTSFRVAWTEYQTPLGIFENRAEAVARCEKADMLPELVMVSHNVTCKVSDLMRAIGDYTKGMVEDEESPFGPCIFCKEDETLGAFRWLISFAVEGGNEGYYVHVGSLQGGTYREFGVAKVWCRESAAILASAAQRFLDATMWN